MTAPADDAELLTRAASSAEFGADLAGEIAHPEFRYEVAEHIAYCFSCIARSLDPEDSAALVLREVLDLPNREAARIVDLSESAFRHRLAGARRTMTEAFDGLCALINKQGACHQCSTLRGLCPPDRRGPPVEPLGDVTTGDPDALLDRRLAAVRSADVVNGSTAHMHAVMLRFIARHADPPASSD
ncbi:MAG TPA: sigma factor-like helix-turn-helix DNA-binding protein [Kofleriaceae bacterium]|jgi:RNA polymerase sigma-70 factor (ECF subfamily)|nr:sigma factor-like helix-turn-helix DNA-binding protein [Kofleriaceae bacterium]